MNRVYSFIKKLINYAKVYILVGNHDMISQHEFLNENHWMKVLKHWNGVVIVDKVVYIEKYNITLLPYVHSGRFIEALNTNNNNWKNSAAYIRTSRNERMSFWSDLF